MTRISHGGECLLALARAWLHDAPAWELPADAPPDTWERVRRHGLDGLAGALVARDAVVPAPMRDSAFRSYCSISLRFRQAVPLCRALRDAAHQAGIPLSFVKGPALAASYGDDGVRGFGDIDVFVPDTRSACVLASDCGLTLNPAAGAIPARWTQRMRSIGRVEAHNREFTVEFTTGDQPSCGVLHELWRHWPERYLLPAADGEPFPVPSREAHLLFLLQHLGQHWLSRLVWLVDFVVLMRSGPFDDAWLSDAAGRIGMRRMLRAVTGFCRRNLDESIRELGRGPTGWKDGLYLAMLAPSAFTNASTFKYAEGPGQRMRDLALGAFQPFFQSDAERPSSSVRQAAPRWTGDWLQFVVRPGGRVAAALGRLLAPMLFLCMLVFVCVVFRRLPAGFARDARRLMAGDDGAQDPHAIPKQGEPEPC